MAVKLYNTTLEQPERIAHHEIASLHRNYTDDEFIALKLGIEEVGQLVPIILYRGKLVDGRHRQRALIELGIHDIKCEHLPNNLKIAEIKEIVLNTETRRTDTVAQKAIRAYNYMLINGNITQQEAGTKFAVNQTEVSQAKKLYEEHGSIIYNQLTRNGYVLIGNKNHTTLRNILKALNTTKIDQKDREPLTEFATKGFELLLNAKKTGDKVAVAQIQLRAQNILKAWDD